MTKTLTKSNWIVFIEKHDKLIEIINATTCKVYNGCIITPEYDIIEKLIIDGEYIYKVKSYNKNNQCYEVFNCETIKEYLGY